MTREEQTREVTKKLLIWIPQSEPGSTIEELARDSGLSLKTVRKYLRRFIGLGKVKKVRLKRRTPGEFFKTYGLKGYSYDAGGQAVKIVQDVRYHLTSTSRQRAVRTDAYA